MRCCHIARFANRNASRCVRFLPEQGQALLHPLERPSAPFERPLRCLLMLLKTLGRIAAASRVAERSTLRTPPGAARASRRTCRPDTTPAPSCRGRGRAASRSPGHQRSAASAAELRRSAGPWSSPARLATDLRRDVRVDRHSVPHGELHLTPVEHVHLGRFTVGLCSHSRRVALQGTPHEDRGFIAGLDD